MRAERQKRHRIRVCLVQPVQAPYWSERLRVLARHQDLEISLMLERGGFAHRPGWTPQPIEGVGIEVLGSRLMRSLRKNRDLGYRIEGIRSIPLRLPFALARLGPDVVIVCNATQLLLALIGKWVFRYRLALIVEDTPHATRNLSRLTRFSRAWVYRRADLRLAFSADAHEYLNAIGAGDRVIRTSWSLDMSSFQYSRGEETRFEGCEAALSSNTVTVLFSGQLVERKGIRELLKSWATLPFHVRKGARLVISGSGPLSNEIANFLRENDLKEVELLGNIPYSEMKGRLSQASLFVLPTLEDLFSLTVLEAMASGCAVITTPFNGARELVDEEKTGWIVDPTETGRLARTLERALSDSVDLTVMGRAARARVMSMDNEPVMQRFADELRWLANDCVGDFRKA